MRLRLKLERVDDDGAPREDLFVAAWVEVTEAVTAEALWLGLRSAADDLMEEIARSGWLE